MFIRRSQLTNALRCGLRAFIMATKYLQNGLCYLIWVTEAFFGEFGEGIYASKYHRHLQSGSVQNGQGKAFCNGGMDVDRGASHAIPDALLIEPPSDLDISAHQLISQPGVARTNPSERYLGKNPADAPSNLRKEQWILLWR